MIYLTVTTAAAPTAPSFKLRQDVGEWDTKGRNHTQKKKTNGLRKRWEKVWFKEHKSLRPLSNTWFIHFNFPLSFTSFTTKTPAEISVHYITSNSELCPRRPIFSSCISYLRVHISVHRSRNDGGHRLNFPAEEKPQRHQHFKDLFCTVRNKQRVIILL